MKTKLTIVTIALLTLLSTLNSQLSAASLGTAFTYQGRLNDGGNPANGTYDLKFTLYDADGGGRAVAGPLTNSPTAPSRNVVSRASSWSVATCAA